MKTVCSHTLVKQGKPFIDLVLRQVIPFMERCLITISEKSTDGTLEILRKLEKEFPNKLYISFEKVQSVGELTQERQKQLDQTVEDWCLFLDDDDYWPTDSIEEMIKWIEKEGDNVEGFVSRPYQVIDSRHYDGSWRYKWYLKWFRNQPGLNYRDPWPRDILYLNDTKLYWRFNKRVPRLPPKFFHLSYLKDYSFRDEKWAGHHAEAFWKGSDKTQAIPFPEEVKKNVWKIYDHLRNK